MTKLSKILRILAAAAFLTALAVNVKVTLTDPFVGMSEEAVAQMTSSDTSSNSSGGTNVTGDYKVYRDCEIKGTFTFDIQGDADLLTLFKIKVSEGQVEGTITATLDLTLKNYAWDCFHGTLPDPYISCQAGSGRECPELPVGG
jgi:cytoskeletal protein CcmA (bactofilin family)